MQQSRQRVARIREMKNTVDSECSTQTSVVKALLDDRNAAPRILPILAPPVLPVLPVLEALWGARSPCSPALPWADGRYLDSQKGRFCLSDR